MAPLLECLPICRSAWNKETFMVKPRDGKFYVILTFEIPLHRLEETETDLFPERLHSNPGPLTQNGGLLHSIVKQPIKSNCLNLGYTFPYIVEFSELQLSYVAS